MRKNSTESVRQWRKEQIAKGWKHFAVLLPPEVLRPVLDYKNLLLDSYRQGKFPIEKIL